MPRASGTSLPARSTVESADAGIWIEQIPTAPTQHPLAESADEVLARLERYAARVRADRLACVSDEPPRRSTQALGTARSILAFTTAAAIVVESFVWLDRALAWCVVAVLFSGAAAALLRRARWAPALLVGAIAGITLALLS
jgi:hypothetical protein